MHWGFLDTRSLVGAFTTHDGAFAPYWGFCYSCWGFCYSCWGFHDIMGLSLHTNCIAVYRNFCLLKYLLGRHYYYYYY